MALDKVLIGARIRYIRETIFEESRKEFANRCELNERYIGQLERGEFYFSLQVLDKISISTGIDTDFILYGKKEKTNLKIKDNLIEIIERADKEEVKVYYKCVMAIKNYKDKCIENQEKG